MDKAPAAPYRYPMEEPSAPRFLDRGTPPHIATLILLAGFSALVMNIFIPSLASMADWFGTDYAVMQLSVAGYLAMNAVLQLFIGPMSSKPGPMLPIVAIAAE